MANIEDLTSWTFELDQELLTVKECDKNGLFLEIVGFNTQ